MEKFAKMLTRPVAVLAAAAAVLVMHAGSASAAIYEYQGFACGGERMVRCGWVNIDSTNNRIRAYGRAWDTTAATVRITMETCYQYRTASGGVVLGGCHNVQVNEVANASSTLVSCYNGRDYRAYVAWSWDPPGSAHEAGVWYSSWVRPNVC